LTIEAQLGRPRYLAPFGRPTCYNMESWSPSGLMHLRTHSHSLMFVLKGLCEHLEKMMLSLKKSLIHFWGEGVHMQQIYAKIIIMLLLLLAFLLLENDDVAIHKDI
jgi:hypothetical protein